MGTTYADINIDKNPYIFPSSGHVISMKSLDAYRDMAKYYVVSQEPGKGNIIVGLKPSAPLSETEYKRCPVCRGSFDDIRRYARIDEATKKFIAWAHESFLPLVDEMVNVQLKLRNSENNEQVPAGTDTITLQLKGPGREQISKIAKIVWPDERYHKVLRLRRRIWQFLAKVDESEQPFQRIHALMDIATELKGGTTLLQVRHRPLATALLLRCDYSIICQFLNITVREAGTGKISGDFSISRKCCEKLIEESQRRTWPAIVVEEHIFWAQCTALERGKNKGSKELVAEARVHLQQARSMCHRFPGQTVGLLAEISDMDEMLRKSTFYIPVTNKGRASVYAAMAAEFRETGHWYYCKNGHPFTIGEREMPIEEAVCPQCGSPVGGRQHEMATGVTRAIELDDQLGRVTV
ncbi:uncharacterized protein CIMG_07498 [Coccidioides immitis RS]|uniref:RZ-type domain-containing protein n=1 Tax=Coccidioides immitis (strain RS) TaxID=246410 RepID=J3K3I6_COCIM|nr:uncharacterized protein CIMG_07498 [Coccidioides immitis RS]EAS28752.3 hypothetical protein CIMG_07498 [Coccidioides immitis RS]TPX23068.1 hypothetical protein DIZ76_014950 [Coccidioides immitis]